MQSDIIKRPPAEPEARAADKPVETPVTESAVQTLTAEPVAPMAVDAIKTQEVPNAQAEPANDDIKPGNKPKDKQKAEEKTAIQLEQPKPPAGPGMAVGTAIFVCLILVGLVIYAQMS